MDNNWIVENLTNAFGVWNSKMTEMWSLLTESPQTFKGGTIWQTIVTINGGMQAIGYGLLVLFFAIGIFRSASGFRDFQRPEHLLRHFIYFVLAKLGMVTKVYAHILDEDRKVNAQKFESAFYANPDLRGVQAPAEPAPALDVQSIILQLQQSPELLSALTSLISNQGCK